MVVLSVAVCTKNGRALLSRQFVPMTRMRIEGLLAAFPKLLGSGSKQHTFVETETVRYVYHPMESLFLLLVTNKASNIVEDLETLRLLSKVVPDVAGGTTEDKIMSSCFDLVFAFDEVITQGGYRENINIQQIRTNLDMVSHEEELHKMIKQSKMDSAKDEANRQAKIIRMRNQEQIRKGLVNSIGGGAGLGGLSGGGGGGGMDGMGSDSYGGGGDMLDSSADLPPVPIMPTPTISQPAAPRLPAKGMKLGGGGKKSTSLLDAMVAEDNLAPMPTTGMGKSGSSHDPASAAAAAAAEPPPPNSPVNLVLEEKLTVQMNREGGIEGVEVKGTLSLTANQADWSKCKVLLDIRDEMGFNLQTHPKVSRPTFDETGGTIVLKDASKGFPLGRAVGVLRWSLSGNNAAEESTVPLSINCWPEDNGDGTMLVNIEYTLTRPQMSLHNVRVVIPLGDEANDPEVLSCDGATAYSSKDNTLGWSVDLIDTSNVTGSLEFTVAGRDSDAFFPVLVGFASKDLYCGINVTGVQLIETEAPVQHSLSKNLLTDAFTIS